VSYSRRYNSIRRRARELEGDAAKRILRLKQLICLIREEDK
jgi:hypothetical protein